MRPEYVLTIGPEHVGQVSIEVDRCPTCGKSQGRDIWVPDLLGKVLPGDVGKRVYRVDGVYQVENDEQRDKRLAKEAQ